MEVISSGNVLHIIRKALNFVDPRLMDHGERVAYIIYKMLHRQATSTEKQIEDQIMLALLHDVGAYKTEHIDTLFAFETTSVWQHSIYGYLFLKHLSPLNEYADVILFHHLAYQDYGRVNILSNKCIASLLHLADYIDVALMHGGTDFSKALFRESSGTLFDPQQVELFLQTNEQDRIMGALQDGSYEDELEAIAEKAFFTIDERWKYLRMIAYSIDFRSEFMVLHTVTTVNTSCAIAELMGFTPLEIQYVYYGSLLHDIGKIATPISILEKPSRLTNDEMEIMKKHVVFTGEILGDFISPTVYGIAVRHHEKLDGSGYPQGLTGKDLSPGERIVAIADIISALTHKRSYKDAYDRARTQGMLADMRDRGKLCPDVVTTVLTHFDAMMDSVEKKSYEVLKMYQSFQPEYLRIYKKIIEANL